MEKIISIKDLPDFKIPDAKTGLEDGYNDYEGFVIETDKQKIYVGVDNHSSCCESWGHVHSEDDFDEFIGAELLSLAIVDKALNSRVADGVGDNYDGGVMFVNFETSKGLFQLAVYNSHNGYYGHTARVYSEQLKEDTCL